MLKERYEILIALYTVSRVTPIRIRPSRKKIRSGFDLTEKTGDGFDLQEKNPDPISTFKKNPDPDLDSNIY